QQTVIGTHAISTFAISLGHIGIENCVMAIELHFLGRVCRREVDFGPRKSLDEVDLFLGTQRFHQAFLSSDIMQVVKVTAAENGIDYNDIRNPLTPQSKQFVELGYTHKMSQPGNQLSNYMARLDRQEHEGRARHTSVIAVLDEAQLVAPDLTAPAIGLPPGGGLRIAHFINESTSFYKRVETVFVAAQDSTRSSSGLGVFVEDRVEHDTRAGAQHAIGEVEPLTIILRIRMVHDRHVKQRISAHRGVNRHRDAQLVDLHNAFRD